MVNAQIKVGPDLVKPKAIHVLKDGQWQEKRVGYIFKNGEWIPFITYEHWIYQEGETNVYDIRRIWGTDGTSLSVSSNIRASARGGSTASGIASMIGGSDYIDVTDYNKLFIDLEMLNSNNGINIGLGDYWSTGNSQNPYSPTYAVRRYSNFRAREIIELDISSLEGDFRFIFDLYDNRYSNSTNVDIFNIWLE